MKTITCDKCGAIIEQHSHYKWTRPRHLWEKYTGEPEKRMDLCTTCEEALHEWLESGK